MKLQGARPVHILLVEDSDADVALTRAALSAAKVLVSLDVVMTGEAAIKYLRRAAPYESVSRPDLVLLDIKLPGISGIETLRALKSHETTRNIPVVMLTSSTQDEDILRSYDAHANAYIAKPVDMEAFRTVVQRLEDFWFSVVVLPGPN